jgi:hypothetical protein
VILTDDDGAIVLGSRRAGRGELLRVHPLAEQELPGERPLGPLGRDDIGALTVVGVRSARYRASWQLARCGLAARWRRIGGSGRA